MVFYLNLLGQALLGLVAAVIGAGLPAWPAAIVAVGVTAWWIWLTIKLLRHVWQNVATHRRTTSSNTRLPAG